ncbi:hypothetical protein [Pseudooceanicola sp.]|uniref:hypothetical protein n=1 Tax=Pseudooceanicola sp. TaxID=1914328 RepID=UPI004058C5D9
MSFSPATHLVSENKRQLILMLAGQGYGYHQVAAAADVQPGTVRRVLQREQTGACVDLHIPHKTLVALDAEARRRGVSVSELVLQVVERMIADGLFTAVMDDEGVEL